MSAIKRPKALRGKEARRKRILAAAKDLLQERGHWDISMRALADAADVSMMTLYNLIGTRDDILVMVVKEETTTALSKIRWRRTATATESILAIPGHYFEYLSSSPAYLRTLNTVFNSPAAKDARGQIIAPRRAWWISIVANARAEGELHPDLDIEAFVLNLETILAGAMREWSSDGLDTRTAGIKVEYGFALALFGVASPHVRPIVERRLFGLQAQLAAPVEGPERSAA